MEWRKSSQELKDFFHEIVPRSPLVEPRTMFGYPCCFVRGNMFMGLHQENMLLRLSEKDREQFLKIEGAEIFAPLPGRVMKEYVKVPKAMHLNAAPLHRWVERSLQYALALPPKKGKPAKTPAARSRATVKAARKTSKRI